MTTPSLPSKSRSVYSLSDGWGIKPNFYRKGSNRTLVVEHEAVFRSGTFRDSMGYQNEWLDIHMRQMMENFSYLRNNKIFQDVPVRNGHPGWLINGLPGLGQVIGYHTNLTTEKLTAPHDGNEYDYVFADYEILDGPAADAYESGLFRNRSSEIIPYVTNSEAEFWPVYGGFAFVDIPAVEGLNFSREPQATQGGEPARVIVMFDKEIPNMTSPVPGPAAPADRPALGGGTAPSYTFSVNGQPTSDFAAVQRHITTLETQASEARTAARKGFVNGLAQRNLILATAIEPFTAAVAGMDDATYDNFCKGYENVPAIAAVSQHAAPAAADVQGTAASNGSAGPDNATLDVEICRDIVAAHRRNGMDLATLKGVNSYVKLTTTPAGQAALASLGLPTTV